jgi:hypothetical protein
MVRMEGGQRCNCTHQRNDSSPDTDSIEQHPVNDNDMYNNCNRQRKMKAVLISSAYDYTFTTRTRTLLSLSGVDGDGQACLAEDSLNDVTHFRPQQSV